MKRILALFLLSSFVLAACGSPITDKSHEKSPNAAEQKAEKAAGTDAD
ncbi:MAG: hypothetical protein JST12_09205 [Armatimonadetes bacterium]|nr:hypothetical protein [Armatimonadota bacterium]MBS1727325.1 hypothetical protein [Armatimonadota bacterium]